jgi:predicted esterase
MRQAGSRAINTEEGKMKRISTAIFSRLTLGVVGMLLMATMAYAEQSQYGMPVVPAASAKYLFFFHNLYVETKGPEGDCKYYDILKTFTDKGFVVISELRPKDASVVEYARKGTANIQKLLDSGVPAENITVAGHSKGAVIAIQIASLLRKSKVNYVIMAGCGIKALEKAYPNYSLLKGNILSIYATSDKIAGSCNQAFSQIKEGTTVKEIAVENAAGHQLFFKPVNAWVEPVISWLK